MYAQHIIALNAATRIALMRRLPASCARHGSVCCQDAAAHPPSPACLTGAVLPCRELPRDGVGIRGTGRRMESAVGLLHDKAQLPILAVGRQPKIGERLVRAMVPGANFEHLV